MSGGGDSWVMRRTPLGLAVAALLLVAGLTAGGCAVAWVAGWGGEAARVTGVENVREQWRFAYDYEESLGALASNHCSLQRQVDAETNPDTRDQRVSQLLAVEQNYHRVAAEYDAALRDKFRAGLVAPPDVPDRAPTLEGKEAEVCTG